MNLIPGIRDVAHVALPQGPLAVEHGSLCVSCTGWAGQLVVAGSRCGKIHRYRNTAAQGNWRIGHHAQVVAVSDDHIVVVCRRTDEDYFGCAVRCLDHVTVPLDEGGFAGYYRARAGLVAQFEQHPVHNGIGSRYIQDTRTDCFRTVVVEVIVLRTVIGLCIRNQAIFTQVVLHPVGIVVVRATEERFDCNKGVACCNRNCRGGC